MLNWKWKFILTPSGWCEGFLDCLQDAYFIVVALAEEQTRKIIFLRWFKFKNVNQLLGICHLHFQQLFLISHCLLVMRDDDRMASSYHFLDLLMYSFCQTWLGCPPPSSHTRWVLWVIWGGRWCERRDIFVSLIKQRYSFSNHLLAPASIYSWCNSAPTWI